MQIFWKIVQFVLGFILGLLITAGVTAGIAFFILSKLAKTPPKPLFAETISPPVAQEQITTESLPTQTETPVIEVKPDEVETQEDGYRARVTWSDGLTVRAEPNVDSERLGGVEYDQELIVLGTNPEETWQKIRIPDSNVQGWVKAGNLSKID